MDKPSFVLKLYTYFQTYFSKRKAWFTLGFFFIGSISGLCQDKPYIDSLVAIYSSGNYVQQDKLKILKELANYDTDTERKLSFSEELIREATALDSPEDLVQGYLQKGAALRLKGDLAESLESFFQGAKIVESAKLSQKLAAVYIGIADVYSTMGNHPNANKYYQSAIQILRQEGDSTNLANALLNAGDEFITINKWDSALIYTEEAGLIYERIHSQVGEAYSLGNLGMIYAQMANHKQAEKYMNEAIAMLEKLDDYYPISVYLNSIADIYLEKGDHSTALSYAFKSLDLARQYGLKEQVSDANLKLSEIYEKIGNPGKAYTYYKSHIAYRDSVNNIASVQQMADVRTDFEVSKKQIEVDLLNQQKKYQQIIVLATVIALILISLLAIGLYRRNKFIQRTNKIIEREKENSESLLLNILPKETAQELKQHGKVQARKFDSVTVLFADFKAFTQYAEEFSPEKLVESVDFYFSKFDEIIDRYGLEKIKTIGDAYMCAGGLPFPTKDHADKMVLAAIDIAEFVDATKKSLATAYQFEIRIGINTGPVVAGVVGTKKFAFDIWGDTVNIAARMESNSEAGKINISENTYTLIKDKFTCTYRGDVEVKNKGLMKMYYVIEVKDYPLMLKSV